MTYIKTADLMTRNVFTLSAGDTVETALEAMAARRISAVLVLDGEGRPLGILTSNDLGSGIDPQSPLASLMTERAMTVDVDDEAAKAARLMTQGHMHHLPVTEEGEIVGMLSSFDFLKLLTEGRFEVGFS